MFWLFLKLNICIIKLPRTLNKSKRYYSIRASRKLKIKVCLVCDECVGEVVMRHFEIAPICVSGFLFFLINTGVTLAGDRGANVIIEENEGRLRV